MLPRKDNIPNERFPFVTVALILINVVAYLISIRNGGGILGGPSPSTVLHDAAIPYDFTHPGEYCTLQAGASEFGGAAAVTVKCANHPFPGQIPDFATAFTAMLVP